MKKIINVLRWIAVLPTAFLGLSLVLYLFTLLNPDEYSSNNVIDLISAFIAASVYITIGHLLAPQHKRIVDYGLSILFTLFLILIIIKCISDNNITKIWLWIGLESGLICTLIACIRRVQKE